MAVNADGTYLFGAVLDLPRSTLHGTKTMTLTDQADLHFK